MSKIHGVAALPIHYELEDKDNELYFIDPTVGEGKRLCTDNTTDIPKLFAMIRQWISSVSGKMSVIFEKLLKSNISINDIDATTGMSLLQYAVQLGALNEKSALVITKRLLSQGADPSQQGLFTGMNSLHLAAFFNLPSILHVLLKPCDLWPKVEVHSMCSSFHNGTALHIAAESLNVEAVEILLQYKASAQVTDDLNRLPIDCVSSAVDDEEIIKADYIRKLLKQCSTRKRGSFQENFGFLSHDHLGKTVQIQLGADINNQDKKSSPLVSGTLRYLGKLHGLKDIWAGIELTGPLGKNNGSYNGKVYFHCRPSHGIFVLASHVSTSNKKEKETNDVVDNGSLKENTNFNVADRVIVSGNLVGTVRFVGETHFAAGIWHGIELDSPMSGCNNGSVGGIHYFFCEPSVGIFVPASKLTPKSESNNL